MGIKTPEEYVESLRALNLNLYLLGEKIDNWVDHPMIRPSINSVAMTYRIAHEPGHSTQALTESSLTGETVNRFTSLFCSSDDLVRKIQLQRELGRRTGTCFQRCVGMDAINAVYSTTFEIDEQHGTDYHERCKQFIGHVQQNDLTVQGAMTDVKGARGVAPGEQADPDMFVHVVQRRQDGIVIRGAKASQTGTVNSHEVLVMPTLRIRDTDKDYAVCCAFPTDTRGVHLLYSRQPNDTRRLENRDIDVGNPIFGGQETLTIFDDVFVPWQRVFMCGEVDFSGMLVERFATYHRQSYGGCKPGISDVLIGAAAQIAEYNGVARASHVRDKIAEMIHLCETIHACGLACSHQGDRTRAGNYQPDTLLANVCKLNVTRFPYEICRLAEDIAGGLLVTLPSEADLRHPVVGPFVQKYLRGVPATSTESRIRMLSLINSMALGSSAPSYRTESMHGAGSPMAQKIMIGRHADLDLRKELARRLAGITTTQV